MSKIKKRFDSVDMMRSIRDKISSKIEGMTLEKELEWLASRELKALPFHNLLDRFHQRPLPVSSSALRTLIRFL